MVRSKKENASELSGNLRGNTIVIVSREFARYRWLGSVVKEALRKQRMVLTKYLVAVQYISGQGV